MDKEKLVKALKKYHLNGLLNDAVLEIKDGVLTTKRFRSDSGIIGTVEYKDIDIEDCEMGIYFTSTFLKMLSIVEKDTKCKVFYNDDNTRVVSLEIKDKKGKTITFATCDPDIVTTVYPKSPKVTDFEVKINLNEEIINDILKAQAAIDSAAVTFKEAKGKLFIVFGYSKTTNDNSISFELECEELEDIETLSFDNDNLRNVLQTNLEKFNKATLEISSKGLLKLCFEDDDYKAEYYLLKSETDN